MKKILLIEDEKEIREALSEILEFNNFSVSTAENGRIGVQKALDDLPDLVICDMMMPVQNGLETVSVFKDHQSLKCIPFIFLSALSEMSDLRAGMNKGAEDYITKPFQVEELLATVELQFKKVEDQNEINQTVIEKHEALEKESAIKDKKWTDYLNSAKTVQNFILPKKKHLKELFPNNFIYFNPKYKVSGDFYWVQDFGDEQLVAVADCTGHGISASLLTICCYNGLNLAVKHYGLRRPKEILEKVNEFMIDFLQAHGQNEHEIGMDTLLCTINLKEKKIIYAGAKRPLFMITEKLNISDDADHKIYHESEDRPLYKINGSSFTVGSTNKRAVLREHTIDYREGDLIYLSSDGYADQFGGPSDKCFRSMNLIRLLISTQNERMDTQKKIIKQTHYMWRGDQEQTDDITLLGIRL